MTDPVTTISAIDVGRASRMSLASLNHDMANMNAVITEADAEDGGIVRLLVALAGVGAVLSNRLSPAEPDAYLLQLVDESMGDGV
ncbi:hypothetical protein CH267_14840 [Rhodococcus sp. 06-621-2]|nr:hypothetical protein [Rhodococcus sp. 06-621-2]OZC55817.1 hypothetical protein CH267_14840 [Rhodococcus sp. 06-621-2]